MVQTITVLNVAEKPSVARALSSAFDRLSNERARCERQAHQVFFHERVPFPSAATAPGNGQHRQGPVVPHKMITTSVRGHLASQDFPAAFNWNQCDPVALFDAPIETYYSDDMKPLKDMLQRLARPPTQILLLWIDCDREGEAIGQEVTQVCLDSNPNLKVLRAKFSTVLFPEIQRALHAPVSLNQRWVDAVQARSQLDLRVGAAFTRFQTLRLQRKFEGLQQGVLSYGPCQFPTLGFVVERWARMETFVPEDFWYLELTLQATPESRPLTFAWQRTHLYDRLATLCLYEECLVEREAVVTQVSGRTKNKWRPIPLATVELQKRASRYLRIGSETLMTAAENLYQQGYISYPRTETEKFRPEFDHQTLIQQLAGAQNAEFAAYAQRLTSGNHFQRPRAGQNDDQAHPPITPCKAVDPSTIADPTQRQVYVLVVKHYLACCSRDAVGRETQATVRVGTEEFNARGLMVLEENWLAIYKPWERWGTGQGELPPMEVGSRIEPESLVMKEGRSTAPLPLSEVELISLMDRNGIGTDATIAQHISTILDREYATKDGNQRFHPTKLGIALVEGYNSMGYQLNKPDLRREMEAECNFVAGGQKTKEEIMAPILAKMKQCYQTATEEARKLDEAVGRHFSRLGTDANNTEVVNAHFSLCGRCNNPMALKRQRDQQRGANRNQARRKLLYCGTCSEGWSLPRGEPSPKTENDTGGAPTRCPICQYQVIQVSRGDGYEGNGYHVCPRCFSDPPMEHGGTQNGEFRCFSCRHPTCSLASGTQGGDTPVFPCPFCRDNTSQVVLRKNSRGYVLSCNKYIPGQDRCPYTIWLPKEVQSAEVPGDENHNTSCPSCMNGNARKICLVWKPGSLPPHWGRDWTGCVLCDSDFRRELRVNLPQPGQVVARPRTNGGRVGGGGRATGGRGGRNGRGGDRTAGGGRGQQRNNGGGGNACYKCGQPGHFANACPSR